MGWQLFGRGVIATRYREKTAADYMELESFHYRIL